MLFFWFTWVGSPSLAPVKVTSRCAGPTLEYEVTSITCRRRSRNAAVGTLKTTATVAVIRANADASPAVESCETSAVPLADAAWALLVGEPIDIVLLLGMASRAWSWKAPPAQAT